MGQNPFLPELARGGGPPQAVEGRRTQSAGYAGGPSTTRFASGPPPRDELGEEFAARAVRLAGLAGVLFGWGPGAFWGATPAELGALVRALAPEGATPPDAGLIARLQEAFPDG